MVKAKRLIFKINDLEKKIGSFSVLKINKLEIHPGTIYGIIGTVGSGKTTLMNMLAGIDKQTTGSILYDDKEFKKNWFGKITSTENIFYTKDPSINGSGKTVSKYIAANFEKKKHLIKNRYFNNSSFNNLWNRNLNDISAGESNWLGIVLACESDPRVLLIDDYGMHFNNKMEKSFRNQIIKMNRTLGTTIILTAPSDLYLKYFCSVTIFLDHGHISKIRSRGTRGQNRKYVSKGSKKNNSRRGLNRKKN